MILTAPAVLRAGSKDNRNDLLFPKCWNQAWLLKSSCFRSSQTLHRARTPNKRRSRFRWTFSVSQLGQFSQKRDFSTATGVYIQDRQSQIGFWSVDAPSGSYPGLPWRSSRRVQTVLVQRKTESRAGRIRKLSFLKLDFQGMGVYRSDVGFF